MRTLTQILFVFLFSIGNTLASFAQSQNETGKHFPAINPEIYLSQLDYKKWTAPKEISGGAVYDLAQTTDGYLWLATQEGGVMRFDGQDFLAFNSQNIAAFTSDQALNLCVTDDESLWISLGDGSVVRFDGLKFERLIEQDSLTDNAVKDIFQDSYGKIWMVRTSGNLECYSFQKNSLLPIELPGPLKEIKLPTFWVSSDLIYEDQDQALWIGTQGNGVYRFIGDSLYHYTTAQGLNHDLTWAIKSNHPGEILVTTRKGISRYDQGRFVDFSPTLEIEPFPIMDLVLDRAGSVWIPGLWGIFRHNQKEIDFFDIPKGVYDGMLLEDRREAIVWGSSITGVLYRFKENLSLSIDQEEGLAGDHAICVFGDSQNRIWVGHAGAGLDVIEDKKVVKHFGLEEGLPDLLIFGLHESTIQTGSMWIGTNEGLVNMHNTKIEKIYTEEDGLSNRRVRVIIEDRNDPEALWLGTIDGGVNRFKNGEVTHYREEDGLADNNIRWLISSKDNSLWIGSQTGIHVLSEGKIKRFTKADGLSSTTTRCGYEDTEGDIWIGTHGGGLLRYKNGQFMNYDRKDGLISNDIEWISFDASGHLWLSYRGSRISRIKKEEIELFDTGKITELSPLILNEEDGILDCCNTGGFPAGWINDQEQLFYPGLQGLVILDLNQLSKKINPDVSIQAVTVGEKTEYFPSQMEYPSVSRNLEITYAAPIFTTPGKLSFQYRLAGFEEEWLHVNHRRSAYYSKLPPGNYLFEVRGSMDGTFDSAMIASLPVLVTPAWWQTKFIKLLGVIVLIGLFYLIYKMRLRAIQASHRKLESQVEDRTKNLSLALENLQNTQKELVKSEKLALLGRLMANITHEINTPMGAIGTSSHNIAHNFDVLVDEFPQLITHLDENQFQQFFGLVKLIMDDHPVLLGIERRQSVKEFAFMLEKEHVPNVEHVANTLTDLGLSPSMTVPYLDLIKGSHQSLILHCLYSLSRLKANNLNIRNAVDRSSKILFALKKYAGGKKETNREIVQISDSLDLILTLYKNKADEVELINHYDQVPPVKINQEEFNQVWTNLIINALQAMNFKGRLEIVISSAQAGRLGALELDQNKQYVVVGLTDNGPGISEDILPHIFEPFFTTKLPGEGSGLGLDITKKIIEDHDGAIAVHSEPGMTTFEVWIPAAEDIP